MSASCTNVLAPELRSPNPRDWAQAASNGKELSLPLFLLARHADDLADFLAYPSSLAMTTNFQQATIPFVFFGHSPEPTGEIVNTSLGKRRCEALIRQVFPDLAKPEWYDDLEENLVKLSHLPEDWRGESGAEFSQEMLAISKSFFATSAAIFPVKPIVYPTKKGDLTIEVPIGPSSLTIVLMKDDLILFTATPTKSKYKVMQGWREQLDSVVGAIEEAVVLAQSS